MIVAGDPIRITAPAALPLSLAELKSQTRVEHPDEDAILVAYLRASVQLCEQYTGMGFIAQSFAQSFASFPTVEGLVLGRRPLQAVLSVAYLDQDGVSQTLDPSSYRVSGIGADKLPAALSPAHGQSWPDTISEFPEAITIAFSVGFGDSHNDVPEVVRLAISIAAATMYQSREDMSRLPLASKALLEEWRLQSVV